MNKYKKDILSNKVPLFTIPVKNARTATVLIMFKTGSKYENSHNHGISHFLEHLFFKGTIKHPNTLSISSKLDVLGGVYNAFTAKEYTGYWVKVASDKLLPALKILQDMLLNSKFAAEEIEREKQVIIEELNMYEENPLMHVEDVFETCLYGDSPAGWETIGTKASIRSLTRPDFLNYFKTQYGAASVRVILAGGLRAKDKGAIKKLLEEFKPNKPQAKKPVSSRQTKPQMKILPKQNDQVNLSLGVRAFPIGHPEEYRLKLLGVILGGAMSSRLFIRLRERSGLAYYVQTSAEFYSDSGYLTTQAGVPAGKTAAAIKIILEEYKKLTQELIKPGELKRAKDLLYGRLLLQMEATDNLANWYGRQAILRPRILTPGEFLKQINKIKAVDLRRTAKKVFVNKGLNLGLIGKVKKADLEKVLKF